MSETARCDCRRPRRCYVDLGVWLLFERPPATAGSRCHLYVSLAAAVPDVGFMNENLHPLRVLKFGGTSLADAASMVRVVDIVADASGDARCVVVVSAMGGVTDALAGAVEAAAAGDRGYELALEGVFRRHDEAAAELGGDAEVIAALAGWTEDLRDLLHGISLVRECTARTLDSVLGVGELVSSTLLAAAFRQAGVAAAACDARTLLTTDDTFGDARVLLDVSRVRVRDHFGSAEPLQVVTGFIAATAAGEATTLGRGGSDYTASLLGAMLGADRVEIWTDVDGIMSADPRIVPEAFSLESLSFDELLELSHFGAKVVHPSSVHPARERGVPLLIRNTLRPAFPGTWVGAPGALPATRPVRGISSIRQVALLQLEGDGMVGVPGIAERLFRALARDRVSVVLISQASSEHSICFAVDPASLDSVCRAVNDEFALEREVGLIDELVVELDRSVVAVVGEGMRDTPGIAGRLFSVLGERGLNVRVIAQGSSELNISLVVDGPDMESAVRALHRAFFTSFASQARVYVAGIGGVGRALLRQLADVRGTAAESGVSLEVVGLAGSRWCRVDEEGIPEEDWGPPHDDHEGNGQDLVNAALSGPGPLRIFVDCTADAGLPDRYAELLDAGVAVVAANKRAFSRSYDLYQQIRTPRPEGARAYLETTVGAGLPVLGTLEKLVETGDRIVSIEGVLSGTLGFLLDEVMKGRPFSEAVRDARGLGYTEPDPRDDLSGTDVLRKLVILARESGRVLEPEDVRFEALLPGEDWKDLSVDEFMEWLPTADEHFDALRAKAGSSGTRLCHLASLDDDGVRVRLVEIDGSHPCHELRGTDNLVAIRTDRYKRPLVIRGAGAGHEVTAAGVLADIMRASRARPPRRTET